MDEIKKIKVDNRRGLVHEFSYRANSHGDCGAVQQVFNDRCYLTERFPLHKRLVAYYETLNKPLIIDAGAHIGCASVWFALTWPAAVVIAIEPERENFKLLDSNTKSLDVYPDERAVGSSYRRASLQDPGRGSWAFRVGGTRSLAQPLYEVQVRPIEAWLDNEEFFPLICKIDIEGGEAELFSAHTEWMRRFALIITELHDWLLPGEGVSHNFWRAIGEGNWDVIAYGENVFAFNNDLLR